MLIFFSVKETGSDTEDELRFWLDMMYRAGKTLNSICNQSDNPFSGHLKCLEGWYKSQQYLIGRMTFEQKSPQHTHATYTASHNKYRQNIAHSFK